MKLVYYKYCSALVVATTALLSLQLPPPLASAFVAANKNPMRPQSPWGHQHQQQSSAASTTTTVQQRASSSSSETTTTSSSSILSEAHTETHVSRANLELLSDRGRAALLRLMEHDARVGAQPHVYGNWPAPGTDDGGKRRLAEQLADLDASYPGGLPAYLTKAAALLKESAEGTNPFADFEAVVPEGELLTHGGDHINYDGEQMMTLADAEAEGLQACPGLAFVLVAGGLGERLGYSGIKLELETNLCDNACYLETYARYILALQHRARQLCGDATLRLPLVIMTSGDTDAATRQLLQSNDNFGLHPDQVGIVVQDKVAALRDGAAGLALDDDDRWTVQTKPHGHGDVHHLLYREKYVERWQQSGSRVRHVVFLQDTNALVTNSILPTLGVSVRRGFHMNSICIPRLAGEAAGAIARLEHMTDPDKSLVINVEYNQLDPLLRTQGERLGDVADPDTGYSPFPGNANNIIMELDAYAKTLNGEDQGVVVEFVNPKYKDDTRTTFTKPTRLECMMQDIPKLFRKELGASNANIGYTQFDRWLTFSPAKNALASGQAAVEGGSTAPGTLSSAESDLYVQNQRKLQHAGVNLDATTEENLVAVAGIPVTPGPRVVLGSAFGIVQQDYDDKIVDGGRVRISQRSSLVLDGHHITVKALELDGALVLRAGPDSHVTVDGLQVSNAGWELQELDGDQDYPETVQIRGYTMNKKETREYVIDEPGHFAIGASGELKKIDE